MVKAEEKSSKWNNVCSFKQVYDFFVPLKGNYSEKEHVFLWTTDMMFITFSDHQLELESEKKVSWSCWVSKFNDQNSCHRSLDDVLYFKTKTHRFQGSIIFQGYKLSYVSLSTHHHKTMFCLRGEAPNLLPRQFPKSFAPEKGKA